MTTRRRFTPAAFLSLRKDRADIEPQHDPIRAEGALSLSAAGGEAFQHRAAEPAVRRRLDGIADDGSSEEVLPKFFR